jgi:hypothetical protein
MDFSSPSGVSFTGGNDSATNFTIGGRPGTWASLFSFSNNYPLGGTLSTWGVGWNNKVKAWDWTIAANATPAMRLVAVSLGYTGNGGAGLGVEFPVGILLDSTDTGAADGSTARSLCMSSSKPTETYHKQGDLCFNTAAAHGAPMGWVDLSDGANFVPLANVP